MNLIPDAISVVIPTYNRAHLIKASIQSVLDQTLQPYEIIIVDDFSTDNTEEVVNSFNSPLIKFVKNKRKKGANGARNTGILMAQGEYIAFHDSDDIWMKDKLKLQKKIIGKGYDLCFCSLIKEENEKSYHFPYKKYCTKKINTAIRYYNIISTQAILIKRDIALHHLFDEDIKRLQDWDFVLRVRKDARIFHLHEPLVIQKINNSSITNNINCLDAYTIIYKKYPDLEKCGIYNKVISQQIESQGKKDLYHKCFLLYLRCCRKIISILDRFI